MIVPIDPNNFGEEKALSSIRSMKEFSEKNFFENFLEHRSSISRIITAAKIYVLDNYEKVSNWENLSLDLHHNRGRQRFGKSRMARRNGKLTSERLTKLLEEIDKETIQIESVSEVVYDWTDGDFSLKINGIDYLWIDGESVLEIANYIEKSNG